MHFGRPIMKLEYFADTDPLYVSCDLPPIVTKSPAS
jgi:hypothetical protein